MPRRTNMFVSADGELAEFLCHAELMGLTAARAEQLEDFHRDHPREDCLVLAIVERYL